MSLQRVQAKALGSPALLARMELLPAEKMLAAVDPGYSFPAVTSLLDTNINNGTLRFSRYIPDTPTGVAYGETLADIVLRRAAGEGISQALSLGKIAGREVSCCRPF